MIDLQSLVVDLVVQETLLPFVKKSADPIRNQSLKDCHLYDDACEIALTWMNRDVLGKCFDYAAPQQMPDASNHLHSLSDNQST
jgi:hypothetical protein